MAAPWEAQRVFLADRFHWTLEYIDGLSWDDLFQVYAVLRGKEKALDDIRRTG